MTDKVTPIPEGFHTLTPHLVVRDAERAIEFYQQGLGAQLLRKAYGPGGKVMHALLKIGDSMLMLADEFPDWGSFGPKSLKGSSVTIHLYVEDVDAFVAHAAAAGAKITMPLQDMFWGDRYCKLEDPFGHQWSVATHVRDVSPDEMQQAAQKACS